MPRKSIQGRLIATVLVSQVLLAAGLVFIGVFYTHRRLLSTLDAGMQSRAMSVAALVRYTEDATGNVYFDSSLMPASLDPAHPDLFSVWTERSGLLVRSANWPSTLDVSPGEPRMHWRLTANQLSYRALRLTHVPVLDRENGANFRPQTLIIVYAAPMVQIRQQVQEAGIFIALASLLLLGLTTFLAWWGVRRGLLPLQRLASQAGLVSAQNWEFRVPDEAQQMEELLPLTQSMAKMLERLRISFVQQKEFVGNAAHELKTPIAVLKSTLQSLRQRPRTEEEYRAGLDRSLEDLDRLERLLQGMMGLARAEQPEPVRLRGLPLVDLGATFEEAIARVRGLCEARGNMIQLSTNGRVLVQADAEDLHSIWVNLLENAVRYSPAGGTVEVAIARNWNARVRVTVADHGPGIAAADLPRIFERFYRGDASRSRTTGGFGLGLAIAKALAEAYGGSIMADSSPGEGTRMIVELPAK